MKKTLKLWRFERLAENLEGRNWYKGHLFMETPKGNVKVTIDHRHLSFWIDEFGTTEKEIESMLLPKPTVALNA